ncbi:MAG TPA: DUF417 family protein [Caulobacteraceae bacterium]|nr:DUF417 family protein [Caulobacteraceae bacterium]
MENVATVTTDRWPRGGITARDGLATLGGWWLTFALALIFLWFGGLKFVAYEQSGVALFITNSPILSWLPAILGIKGGAEFLGVFEIATGLLVAGRILDPRLSILGGAMGMFIYFVTLTQMLSTPGVIQSGFTGPFALSGGIGEFLLKDLISFGGCLWVVGTSLAEAPARRR